MKDINDFIDFIENNRPPGEYRWERDWEKFLTEGYPDWISLVRDPNNWQLIENVRPQIDADAFYKALIGTAGAGLAVRWFNSKEKSQRSASRSWLEDNSLSLIPEIWNELSDDAKEYVILYIFDTYPGEPFKTYKCLVRKPRPFPSIQRILLTLPLTGYVPSSEILQLRSVIRRTGDKKFLKVVEDMIEERRKACEKSFSLLQTSRVLYTPTRDERELVALVLDIFRANGYMPSALPQIYLSFETPPFFVAYPELEEEEEEKIEGRRVEQREPRIPRNTERMRPQTISIEELLGCYQPDPQIILYQKGLKWCARRYGLDEELLRNIVLVHEIGHWVTHLLPKPDVPFWSTELYKLVSIDVCEGWAQLITWWVVDKIDGEIKRVFEKLNSHQSDPYRVYEKFKNKPVNSVTNSLEALRQLRWPARMNDWERFIK